MTTQAVVDMREMTAPPEVAGWQRRALLVGVGFSILSIIGAFLNPAQAMHSYLLGFMTILGLSLGPMAMLMVWHLTGGGWGVGVRRIFEAAAATLPLVALAFIPILFGLSANYPWARPEVLAHNEHIAHLAHSFFTMPFLVGRAVVYFVCWGLLAWFLLRWSDMQDHPGEDVQRRLRAISGGGLVVYFWTISFAVIDWVMSASSSWVSSIYPFIFAVGEGLIGMAFTIIIARALSTRGEMSRVLRKKDFHDYGKYLLMFIMLWGWFSYSQWLLIWSGNLPEEISFYLARSRGGWQYATWLLWLGHFAVPFALLLSRGIKDRNRLIWVAGWLVFMRYWDLYWNIEPNYSPGHFAFSWLDAVIPLALAGLWVAFFFWNLQRRPLVVAYDPHLQELLESHSHHE
jgi:hypothetical protein